MILKVIGVAECKYSDIMAVLNVIYMVYEENLHLFTFLNYFKENKHSDLVYAKINRIYSAHGEHFFLIMNVFGNT